MEFTDEDARELYARMCDLGLMVTAYESPTSVDPNHEATLEAQVEIARIDADAAVAIAEAEAEAVSDVAEAQADVAEAEADEQEAIADQLEAETELAIAETIEPEPEGEGLLGDLGTVLDGDGSPTPIEDAVEDVVTEGTDALEDVVEDDAPPRRTHWFHKKIV